MEEGQLRFVGDDDDDDEEEEEDGVGYGLALIISYTLNMITVAVLLFHSRGGKAVQTCRSSHSMTSLVFPL